MAKENLIIKKEVFEEQLKAQISKGSNLLKREVSLEETTFLRPRRIIEIKKYDETEMELFLADCRKWDSYNSTLIRQSFEDNDSPHSYFNAYGRTGNLTNLFGEDIIKEVKHIIKEKITYLESIIDQLPLITQTPRVAVEKNSNIDKNVGIKSKDVFIVHGHDDGLKNEVARFVTDMGYDPIILHERPNQGKTIIEKIEAFSNVCYAIILYTPCDIGAPNDGSDMQLRARQNVVFEHGYLIGKLGREKVCALIKGDVEKPGDIDGIIYVTYDNRGAWKKEIVKEFKDLGMKFNIDAILY